MSQIVRVKTLWCVVVASLCAATNAIAERQLLWGDTHLHTTYSSDAFSNNNLTATPDTAYRYAKGLPVIHPYHQGRVQIETPLDFLVVSDHAEYMGVIRNVYFNGIDDTHLGLWDRLVGRYAEWVLRDAVEKREARKLFFEFLPEPIDDPVEAARDWVLEVTGIPPQPQAEIDTWREITNTADAHNEPGQFSALVGWEFSAIPGGSNLHRIVLSDIDGHSAQAFQPYGFDQGVYPEELWQWLEQTSSMTGANFIAIPHNSNISKGAMFDDKTLMGEPLTPEWAEIRRHWEPIVEITQIKGDSETHPDLSPEDTFADFEEYPYYIQNAFTPYQPKVGDYIRPALIRGLGIEQNLGINPYQFGVIGSTDAHTALSSAEENNFHGKFPTDSIPANKNISWGDQANNTFGWAMSAQGLAAVWAEDNTRESIVAAMRRREVYATTGPRIGVRFYAGWNLSEGDVNAADFPNQLADRAVPMGGELSGGPSSGSPWFLVEATADPMSGSLDRVQIVKGWVDAQGQSHEHIFDIAWSGERMQADGSLLPVADTVDRQTGHWDNATGATRLVSAWRDPAFDPEQRAFYYVRVLQIPTPRHSLYDKIAMAEDVDTRRPDVIQERAYTSAIWYSPSR